MEGVFGGRRLLLAPMAGVTDPVFRSICRSMGADLAFTEMVSAKALSYADAKTESMLEIDPSEGDISVQVFGHEPHVIAEQAARIEQAMGDELVSIDVNMGCPVRKVVSKGEGSALMKDPDTASRIIEAMKDAVTVPVTCKFRRGWDESGRYPDAASFAARMERAGADAVCVHGRYAVQMYRGSSDNGCIAEVKEAVSIPVIGNGDVQTGDDAIRMRDEAACDAIMIARRADGYPWVFDEIARALDGSPVLPAPDVQDRLEMCRRHILAYAERYGEKLAPMRRQAMRYVHGMADASKARAALSGCVMLSDFMAVLDGLEEVAE